MRPLTCTAQYGVRTQHFGSSHSGSYQVLLVSKKSTRKSFCPASVRLHSPSLSTSTGGTGMGMPLWRSPSWGISGSTICHGEGDLWTMALSAFRRKWGSASILSHHGRVWWIASAFGPHQIERRQLRLAVWTKKCRLACGQQRKLDLDLKAWSGTGDSQCVYVCVQAHASGLWRIIWIKCLKCA